MLRFVFQYKNIDLSILKMSLCKVSFKDYQLKLYEWVNFQNLTYRKKSNIPLNNVVFKSHFYKLLFIPVIHLVLKTLSNLLTFIFPYLLVIARLACPTNS